MPEGKEFGRMYPIKKKGSTEVLGVKTVPFKEGERGLDYPSAVHTWRRDVEDVLAGRIPYGIVYAEAPYEPEQVVAKSRASR